MYIGRPSKWGNPFTHKTGTKAAHIVASRSEAVRRYRAWIKTQPQLMDALHELRGKTLGCWCKPLDCHGDVLAELADAEQRGKKMSAVIKKFRGQFLFLSNFYWTSTAYDGKIYPTAEHAYQAAKALNPSHRRRFQNWQLTPAKAKQIGRCLLMREDWDEVKLEVMEQILCSKFSKEPMQRMLLRTGDAVLIEGNTWGDTFWGESKGWGLNHLGKLLMKIRDALRLKKIAVVGSRSFADAVLLYKHLIPLAPFILISGGAQGADTFAEEFADDHGLAKAIHKPDWDTHGRSAGFKRNQLIVDDAEHLIAFWDGKSKGTAHSIKLAREKGLVVDVVRF